VGNVYNVGICPICKAPIELEDTVMVEGSDNYELAIRMLADGKSVQEVQKEFCGYCGGHIPCGCPSPCPQS